MSAALLKCLLVFAGSEVVAGLLSTPSLLGMDWMLLVEVLLLVHFVLLLLSLHCILLIDVALLFCATADASSIDVAFNLMC